MSPLGASELPDGASESHAHWSAENRRFLDFALRNPEALARSSFAGLHGCNPLPNSPYLQSWPVLADTRRVQEIEHVTVGLDRLFKSVPERFFASDPQRMAKFYDFDQADLLAVVLAQPNGISEALSRGDYIETKDGWKCIELNAGSYLGGWQTEVLEELYLGCPPIAAFLQRNRLAAGHRKTFRRIFSHIIRSTRESVWNGGDLNLAFVLYPHLDAQIASFYFPARFQEEYALALREEGGSLRGRIFVCGYDDLEVDSTFLRYRGERVHAVLEQQNGLTNRAAFRCFKAGGISLFSGPVTMLLSDKRNVALLSERAGSSDFTRQERELIERHVPWTRRVVEGPVDHHGRSFSLSGLLRERRQDMVLKNAQSLGGEAVYLGRFLPAAEWETVLARAFREGSWIVQEHVEPLPYVGQHGEHGWLP
ncbi:MAG TPA: hypothetical protein VF173_37990, partial [Thermoanaerobaculia bacterium]|nr:hypothetical protein [Thermoanaerobaculia bacterium]